MKTNKKILLVEDDSNFGRILKEYLSINNYNVDLASNGIEGYEKFNRSEYDLCILDVMMPYKTAAKPHKSINICMIVILIRSPQNFSSYDRKVRKNQEIRKNVEMIC